MADTPLLFLGGAGGGNSPLEKGQGWLDPVVQPDARGTFGHREVF